MDVEINWLAVLLATASSMAVGAIWYSPKVMGKTWMKLAKIDPKKVESGEGAWKAIGITIVVSFLTAFVLAHVTFLSHNYFQNSFLQDALTTAFFMWLGFVASRFITHDAFEGRPWKLTLLNIAHEFDTLLVMGLIIGLLGT